MARVDITRSFDPVLTQRRIKAFFKGKKCKHCGYPKTIYDFTFCPECKKKAEGNMGVRVYYYKTFPLGKEQSTVTYSRQEALVIIKERHGILGRFYKVSRSAPYENICTMSIDRR